jgi:hypothetical protein
MVRSFKDGTNHKQTQARFSEWLEMASEWREIDSEGDDQAG